MTISLISFQATKQFLEQVNARSTQQNGSPVSWNHAVTFLMARKFDVHRAVDLYYAHEVRDRALIQYKDVLSI